MLNPADILEASYQPLLTAILDWAKRESSVRGVFLSGSLADGTADSFSDLDLVVVGSRDLDAVQEVIQSVEAVIISHRLPPGDAAFILSVVTDQWHRIDVACASEPPPGTVAVYNPDDLEAPTAPPVPTSTPTVDQVRSIVVEFFRILGLSVVVLGRGDVHAGREGADLLRKHLIDILLLEARAVRPGPKKLRPVLSAEHQAVLRGLPALREDTDEIRHFSAAVDRVFVDHAGRLLASIGGEWPSAVEAATRRYLERGSTDA